MISSTYRCGEAIVRWVVGVCGINSCGVTPLLYEYVYPDQAQTPEEAGLVVVEDNQQELGCQWIQVDVCTERLLPAASQGWFSWWLGGKWYIEEISTGWYNILYQCSK